MQRALSHIAIVVGIALMIIPAVSIHAFRTEEAGARVDSADYSLFSYVRVLREHDTIPSFTDDEFFDIAARIVFPVSKWDLPHRDSIVLQLQNQVLPLINRDSLELAGMIIRGAASPEGPYKFNKFLSEHRAQTLIDFLRQHLDAPFRDEDFQLQTDVEDYRTLCVLMCRAADPDYDFVQQLCDRYLPQDRLSELKLQLQQARGGSLWQRLLRQYFPCVRAARVIFFFRSPRRLMGLMSPIGLKGSMRPISPTGLMGTAGPISPLPLSAPARLPRREVLAVKSNLLFDFAYVPGYDRWCPIPNIAIEYFPLHGHFTFGASFDMPWWQHYHQYKFFQLRNYQVEARYYLRSGDIRRNPPGQGAAFRGLYFQGYAHGGLFGICFGENRGWVGEGAGAGVGAGYVLPISRDGHWRLEFGLQVGYFWCQYDPYKYENPINPAYHDDLYYYKWTGKPADFRKRQYHFSWIGPTRIGITLSYDLLYRPVRNKKRGISFRKWEKVRQDTPSSQ